MIDNDNLLLHTLTSEMSGVEKSLAVTYAKTIKIFTYVCIISAISEHMCIVFDAIF